MRGMQAIDSKTAAISELTRQIKERERDLKRLQDGLRLIPTLQEQIKMLEGSVAMIQGKNGKEPKKAQARPPLNNGTPPKTLGVVVFEILKQAGKPLRAPEIVSLSEARGVPINYRSLTKLISDRIRQGKQFYREGEGIYGLKEWKVSN